MDLTLSEAGLFQGLGVALALGILIGIERGWHERTLREGSRVAGIRTFGIIGLLGGVWALLAEMLGAIVLALWWRPLRAVLAERPCQAAGEVGIVEGGDQHQIAHAFGNTGTVRHGEREVLETRRGETHQRLG